MLAQRIPHRVYNTQEARQSVQLCRDLIKFKIGSSVELTQIFKVLLIIGIWHWLNYCAPLYLSSVSAPLFVWLCPAAVWCHQPPSSSVGTVSVAVNGPAGQTKPVFTCRHVTMLSYVSQSARMGQTLTENNKQQRYANINSSPMNSSWWGNHGYYDLISGKFKNKPEPNHSWNTAISKLDLENPMAKVMGGIITGQGQKLIFCN